MQVAAKTISKMAFCDGCGELWPFEPSKDAIIHLCVKCFAVRFKDRSEPVNVITERISLQMVSE